MFNQINQVMKQESFTVSNEIVELGSNYEKLATVLVSRLRKNGETGLIGIDCVPNGSLNAFSYDNGLEPAKIISNLAGSFPGMPGNRLKEELAKGDSLVFKTDYAIGEKAGLWNRVSPNDYAEKLDWGRPLCVKNERGKTRIWHPEWRLLGHNNCFSTKGAIVRFVFDNKAYLQDFYPPLPTTVCSLNYRMHYRLVFSVEKEAIDFLGGLWISRPGFKIFLGNDAVVGLVSPAFAPVEGSNG